jgi:hypothetical protein
MSVLQQGSLPASACYLSIQSYQSIRRIKWARSVFGTLLCAVGYLGTVITVVSKPWCTLQHWFTYSHYLLENYAYYVSMMRNTCLE